MILTVHKETLGSLCRDYEDSDIAHGIRGMVQIRNIILGPERSSLQGRFLRY
jgi:hypothetical protein